MDGRDATDYHSVHGGKIMFSEMRRKKREMDTEAAESLLKCSRRGILAVNEKSNPPAMLGRME